MATYTSTFTGKQIDNAVSLATTALQPTVIKQTTGDSADSVISQKTVTELISGVLNGTTPPALSTNTQNAIVGSNGTSYFNITKDVTSNVISTGTDQVFMSLVYASPLIDIVQGSSWRQLTTDGYAPGTILLAKIRVYATGGINYESTFSTYYMVNPVPIQPNDSYSALVIPIRCPKSSDGTTFDNLDAWIAPSTSKGLGVPGSAETAQIYARLTSSTATGYRLAIQLFKVVI